jgi:hypothetical protein
VASRTQEFVTDAYEDVLHRAPDAAGLAYWTAALDRNQLTRQQVAEALTHSDEYYRNFITGAYQAYLGRTPDAADLQGWLQAMKDGLSDEQVEASFTSSAEYINNHGGPGAGWVTGLYRDLLHREPSSGEVNGWVAALSHGVSPQQVAHGFAAGTEREAIRVNDHYMSYLGRQASQAEVQGWVYAFEHGASDEDIIAGFVGSPEYHAKSVPLLAVDPIPL